MAKYQITEEDFKNLVDWRAMVRSSACKVGPRTGTYSSGTEGHGNCGSCPGNYYNGGECNYGGHHVLAREISLINRNFEGIDQLSADHAQLKLTAHTNKEEFEKAKAKLLNNFQRIKGNCCDLNKFMYATCIGIENKKGIFLAEAERIFKNFARGIERYIEQVKAINWHQVEDFQTKLKQVEQLKKDNNRHQEELADPNTPPERKAWLIATIDSNNKRINELVKQLDKHQALIIFDPKTAEILGGAKHNLFHYRSGTDPFAKLGRSKGIGSLARGDKDQQKNGEQKNDQPSFLSAQNKEFLKSVGKGTLVIAILGVAYWIIKSKLQE